LALGHKWGKPLFELRPDLFPEGFLTDAETELWGLYLDSIKKK
jgi:hypothetical protein